MKFRRIIGSLVLLILVLFAIITVLDPWSTAGKELEKMVPGGAEKITSVLLIRGNDSIGFVKSGDHWMLGNEQVNPQAIENLLLAAVNLKVKGIVQKDELPEPVVPAEIIFKKGKREQGRFFFISDERGFFVFPRVYNNAFLVELTGYEDLPLEKIFSLNKDHYREHLLLELLPDEIISVSVKPISGTAFLVLQDSLANIRVLDPESFTDISETIEEEKVRMLYSYFSAVRYDSIINSFSVKLPADPLSVITLTDRQGGSWKIEVFPWIKSGKENPDLFQALVMVNGKEPLLAMNYKYLDLVMRGMECYRP